LDELESHDSQHVTVPVKEPKSAGDDGTESEHKSLPPRNPLGDCVPPPAQGSEDYVLRLDGEIWEIRFGDECGRFQNRRGLEIIHQLLGRPNPTRPLTAIELSGRPATGGTEEHTVVEAIDAETKRDLQHRLNELPQEIERARRRGDQARALKLEEEAHVLRNYLAKSTGLWAMGRPIGAKAPAESARVAVKQNIDRAIEKLKSASRPMAKLAEHLEANLMTEGNSYGYRPKVTPPWRLS
jgi:hypothetical protein